MRQRILRNMLTIDNADPDTKDQEQKAISNTCSFLRRPSLPRTLSSYNDWFNEESPEGQFNTAEPEREQRTTLTTPYNDQEQNAILDSLSFESRLSDSTYYQSGGDSASNLQNYAGHLLQPQLSSTAGPVSGATDFTNISPLSCTLQYNPGLSNSLFPNQETCGRGLVRSLRVPYQEERNSTSTTAWNNEHHESSRDLTSNPKNYKGMLLGTQQFTSTADFGSLPNDSSSFSCVPLSQEQGHFTSNMVAYNYKYYQSGGDVTTNPQNCEGSLIGTSRFTSTVDSGSWLNESSSLSYVLPSQEEIRFSSDMAAYHYKHHQAGGDLTRYLENYNGSLIETPQFPSTADSEYWLNDLTHLSSISSVSSFQQEGNHPSTMMACNYKHHQSGRTVATNVPTQKGSLFGTLPHLTSTVDVECERTLSSDPQLLLNDGNSNLNQTNMNTWNKCLTLFQGEKGSGFNMRAENHDKHSFTHQKRGNLLNIMQNYGHHRLQPSGKNSASDTAHRIGPSVQSFPIINDSLNLDDQYTNNASLKNSSSENSMENFKLVSHNKNEVSFVSSVCGKDFRTKGHRKCHVRTHKTEIKARFKCDQCMKQFTQRANLEEHTLSHGAEAKIRCDFCQKGFMTKPKLNSHLRVHATTSEAKFPFKCDQCMKQFSNRVSLKQHALSHGAEAKIRCDFCQKGFMTQSFLNKHLSVHATTSKTKHPFKCAQAQCPARFSTKALLMHHNMTDHGAEAKMHCDFCQKGFMTQWRLKCHLRIHASTREAKYPFKCVQAQCPARFSSKVNLEKHNMNEHGAQPKFHCNICSKGFMKKYDLKRHSYNHDTNIKVTHPSKCNK